MKWCSFGNRIASDPISAEWVSGALMAERLQLMASNTNHVVAWEKDSDTAGQHNMRPVLCSAYTADLELQLDVLVVICSASAIIIEKLLSGQELTEIDKGFCADLIARQHKTDEELDAELAESAEIPRLF